jgi:hypothetical protein
LLIVFHPRSNNIDGPAFPPASTFSVPPYSPPGSLRSLLHLSSSPTLPVRRSTLPLSPLIFLNPAMSPSKPRGFPISLWKLASSDLERCCMLEFWSRIASDDRVEIVLAHAQARFDLNPLPMPPPSTAVPTSVWLTYLKAARKQMMESWHKMGSRERVLDQLALAVTLTPPVSSLQETMDDRPLVHLLGSDLYMYVPCDDHVRLLFLRSLCC